MYNLKGFLEYPSLINNSKDVVAVIGELSSNSRTYAKDKTTHTNIDTPSVSFISFHSVRDESLASVDSQYKNIILNIGDFIYKQSVNGTINANPMVFRQLLLSEFNTSISELSSGKMVSNGAVWMPEWIEFTFSEVVESNAIRLWLSDEAFSGQYDEYEIEVVHPIIPFDDFFKEPLTVRDTLKAYDLVEKLDEVQNVRKEYPYTHIRAFSFDYTPPGKPQLNTPAYWIVIIYGENGNNPDLIKEKIVAEILADTAHTRSEWEEILPDLFKTTEFIFTPFWDQYSIPQSDHRAGIYSPTIDYRKRLPLILRTVKGNNYTNIYVEGHFELSVNIYKSLAFSVVGSPSNKNGITQFSSQFKDYMVVTNDSPDINRANPNTVEWMTIFSRLIVAAEAMTKSTSVPHGVSRMVRDGVVYATAYYKNVNYLVASKSSVEELG